MIPKIIHQIWIQGYSNLPQKYVDYSNRWKSLHNVYEYILWDDEKLLDFIKNNYPQYLLHYEKSNMTNKSNIGRYLIMHKIGGVYCDVDSYPIKPIDTFLDSEYDITITRRNKIGSIKYNAAISIAKPYCKIWIDIMEFALNRTDLRNIPIEPFGVLTLNMFIDKYNPQNVNITDPIYFDMKEDKNLPHQYIIHDYDANWK